MLVTPGERWRGLASRRRRRAVSLLGTQFAVGARIQEPSWAEPSLTPRPGPPKMSAAEGSLAELEATGLALVDPGRVKSPRLL